MIFPAHAWFSTGKINVKLAYTYRGRTKIYFLKWGLRTKKFEKPCLRWLDNDELYKISIALVVRHDFTRIILPREERIFRFIRTNFSFYHIHVLFPA